jgi:myo-inositol-1-phosphate synthase
VYAYAAARSNVHASFINAAAQCTLTLELLAEFDSKGRIALGNDLCTGQTRLKHALLGTFVAQGIPVQTVVNFNTLGNNDGLNLASQHTNASKITSKASTCERLAQFAPTLYHSKNVDQLVQIAYVPSIGDNKRAMDEYILELPLSHKMDMFINTVCPDTALALGVLTDLVLMSIILGHTTVQKHEKRPITCMQANALCACLLKSPVSPHARLYFQECRDVLTGFLVELCGQNPETLRHRGLF